MKDHYIQAVLDIIHEGKEPDVVIASLSKVLAVKGHQALFGSILKGVLRIMEAEADRTGAVVTLARTADETKHVSAIKVALRAMGASESFTTRIDDSLIGGFIAEVNNTVHDASHKTALVNLYRNLTK